MNIALVSLNQVWENKVKNKKLCRQYIEHAGKQKCDLIIFPEMTLTGFTIKNASELSEELFESDTVTFFKKESKKNSIGIIFGLIIKGEKLPDNKLMFLNKDGTVIGDYSKIHTFSFANEDKYFNKGKIVKYVFFKDVTWGLSICYDLRFPELYQILSKNAEIIVNIANWPKKRVHHWKTLIKARAIENQVYFVGVNRSGVDGNSLEYEESSMVVNPEGIVEKEVYQKGILKTYHIIPDTVKYTRNRFPVKKDRNER